MKTPVSHVSANIPYNQSVFLPIWYGKLLLLWLLVTRTCFSMHIDHFPFLFILLLSTWGGREAGLWVASCQHVGVLYWEGWQYEKTSNYSFNLHGHLCAWWIVVFSPFFSWGDRACALARPGPWGCCWAHHGEGGLLSRAPAGVWQKVLTSASPS